MVCIYTYMFLCVSLSHIAAASSVTSPLCTWLVAACMSVTSPLCTWLVAACMSVTGKWGRWKRVFLYKCSSELQSQGDLISWIQLSGPHDFLPRFLFLSLRIQQCSCSFKSETHPFQSSRPFRYSSFLINFSFFFFLN